MRCEIIYGEAMDDWDNPSTFEECGSTMEPLAFRSIVKPPSPEQEKEDALNRTFTVGVWAEFLVCKKCGVMRMKKEGE